VAQALERPLDGILSEKDEATVRQSQSLRPFDRWYQARFALFPRLARFLPLGLAVVDNKNFLGPARLDALH
jgi:hypothetical protein